GQYEFGRHPREGRRWSSRHRRRPGRFHLVHPDQRPGRWFPEHVHGRREYGTRGRHRLRPVPGPGPAFRDGPGRGVAGARHPTDQVYLPTTVHWTLPNTPNTLNDIMGPDIPGKDHNKDNNTHDVHVIFAFNINIFDHGDAPISYDGGSAATAGAEAISNNIRI